MMATPIFYDEDRSRWKWLILFGSFWSHSLSWGLGYSAGIFQVIFMEEFGGAGKTGMISTVSTLVPTCMLFVGLLSSVLTNRFGHRMIGWAGTLVVFSGFLLTSTATTLWFLYPTFCLIGTGLGLQFVPCLTVLPLYFSKRWPLALGVSSSGLPTGTFLLPPFIRLLVNTYGWRGAFVILSAISLNLGVGASLYRPIRLGTYSQIT